MRIQEILIVYYEKMQIWILQVCKGQDEGMNILNKLIFSLTMLEKLSFIVPTFPYV